MEMETVTDKQPEMAVQPRVVLDDDGDVNLMVKNTERNWSGEFLIFSKVLVLASRVFATMMGPNFMEGQKLRNGRTTILGVLHSQITLVPDDITPEQIAMIAVHCDNLETSCREKGLLFLAGYLFDSFVLEPSLDEEQIKGLPRNFIHVWSRVSLIETHLGIHKIEELSRSLEWINRKLQHEIEHAMEKISHERQEGAYYRMPGIRCDKCGALWDIVPMKEFAEVSVKKHYNYACQCPDGNLNQADGLYLLVKDHRQTTVERVCTHGSRAVDFFRILTKARLFPISGVFNMSVRNVV
ncbi:hypothetical protein B0T22DRAFT_504699 [Podospora appendiculata]|uniref:BTB domain-containing protein n=1 Tax=Podospora appendiculata TaxID=314037 RepID=A0AAE0XH40_9PEZI|nr:hypothetical protein B0T22DRAFT_504699 [Podospora appendiculata]